MGVIQTHYIDVPEDARVDLRERIAATRWPDIQSHGVQFATIRGGEGKHPLPPGAIIAQFAGREATSEESDKAVRPFVERGRDEAAVERLLAESFVAASAADVQFMVKDFEKIGLDRPLELRSDPSVTTSSTKAAILPLGSSQSCSAARCEHRSDRYACRRSDTSSATNPQ